MTSAWFTKNLGDAMLAGDALAQLEALFLSTYGESGQRRQNRHLHPPRIGGAFALRGESLLFARHGESGEDA